MSTRSKTRSSLTAKVPEPIITSSKPRSRAQTHNAQSEDMDVDSHAGERAENVKTLGAKSSLAPLSGTRKSRSRKTKPKRSLRTVDCTCSKGDDGSPMIHCSQCRIWYHFTCVDINEPDAEEIRVYVCPTCTKATGYPSIMVWEGDDAIEEDVDDETTILARRQVAFKLQRTSPEPKIPPTESEDSSNSEDDYTEEKGGKVGKENIPDMSHGSSRRRLSTVSDSNSNFESRTRQLHASPSPIAQGPLKRKATIQRSSSPPSKKKRSGDSQSTSAANDPARSYCLGKLQELFKDVFLRYPHVRVHANSGKEPDSESMVVADNPGETQIVPKKLEELSEEEKEALIKESEQFSRDLESCVFEIYSEPDKGGHPHAGGKYKERFRMLQFNLSKVDRVIIHQRITSGTISPKEISLMSSTDLADEETKQSIKLAEKEALEHSILLKSTVPRAKITHKGLQDIEDVNGEVATVHEKEVHKEREQEEEDRRERERMARLRTTQRQRTASLSVPPESPTVPQSTSIGEQPWGGPPPVPAHAMSPTATDFSSFGQRPALFMHTSDLNTTELELNLADLINIDDDHDPASSTSQSIFGSNHVSSPSPVDATSPTTPSPVPTGISPFAARPERQRGASFDLNSLWNMPKNDAPATESTSDTSPLETTAAPAPAEESRAEGSDKDDAMELESVEANDQDFDMFLEEKDSEPEHTEQAVIPAPPQDVESLPQVWIGKLTMPLDSSIPQETSLVAHQIAGRHLPADSPLWKTLFPSDQLRIEGRVAVENSVKYLVGMRLNAAKELYAAAFVPAEPNQEQDFKTLCNILISKGRHGLVFPWGSRPKEYHPGRELYVIPLLQTDPLPEFVELLDDLKLPKTRTKDYLLGVWILNKGKLAVLPNVYQHPPAPAPAPAPALSAPPRPSQTPPLNMPTFSNTPPPTLPQFNGGTPQPPLPPSIPGLPIAPAALAAEVASLTPEQLQEVLRTLASTTSIQLPNIPQLPPPPPTMPPSMHNINRPPSYHVPTPPLSGQPPPVGPTPSMPHTAQPWMQPPPLAPYSNYPPPNVPFQAPPPHALRGPDLPVPPARSSFDRPDHDRQDYGHSDYDRQHYDRDFQPAPYYQQGGGSNRGERGWRGNSGNRGGHQRGVGGHRGNRGRGSGDGHEFNARRDSGWPRRQRNEEHSGPSW